jgi:hypothetical protein
MPLCAQALSLTWLNGSAIEMHVAKGKYLSFSSFKEQRSYTVGQIWQAFEKRIGHEVDDSTIYRLLNRHGWRKLMPRPRRPQADPQAQEQFKKTFQRRWKRQSQREKRKMCALF